MYEISTPEETVIVNTKQDLFEFIDKRVCGLCKAKPSEIPNSIEKLVGKWETYLPENYESLSLEEKISELLSTACGAKMYVEEVTE